MGKKLIQIPEYMTLIAILRLLWQEARAVFRKEKSNMPFKSKAQEKWAWANKKPWAKEWADKTDFSKLPDHVTAKDIAKRIRKKLVKKKFKGKGGEVGPTGEAKIRLSKLSKEY